MRSVLSFQAGTSGKGYPFTISDSQARNREQTAVGSTRQTVTWSTGVREITINVTQEAAGTANLQAAVLVCFDAPSDLVADEWLAPLDSSDSDRPAYKVSVGVPRTFKFTSGVTRADVVRLVGSEALDVFFEAGE